MSHKLYDIWEDQNDMYSMLPWRLQCVNYVAFFSSRAAAEGYAALVKQYRAKNRQG